MISWPVGLVERAGRFIGEDDGRLRTASARAMAMRCIWPPLISPGRCWASCAQSQSFQPQHGRVGGLSVVRAAQHHRQGDVFDGRQFRQQLSGLEDEAEGAAAQFGAVSVAQPRALCLIL